MKWPASKIGDITHIITKGTTPTREQGFSENGVNFIKAEALNGDSALDPKGIFHISEDVHQQLKRSILQKDDVLLTIAGVQIGKCGIVKTVNLPANTNQAVGIMRVDKSRADPRFIYYWFKQKRTFSYIQGLNAQAAQPNINLTMLKNIEVPLPTISDQHSISFILTAYDDLIENNLRRMQLLELSARILYKEWFVELRFPGHEHVKIKDGLPEGWMKVKLGEVASTNVQSYKANSLPNEINYIDITSVKQGRILAKNTMPFSEAPGRARRKAATGDVIWSNVRPNLRAYALILDPDENDVFSTGFTILSPLSIPFSYLYLLVTTDQFVGHLVNHTTGASYPAVRPDDFERAVVLYPSQNLLQMFHDKMEPIFRMIHVLDNQAKKLSKARDLILPRLMNGEITV
jgi:type I restriction enzyme S subunit